LDQIEEALKAIKFFCIRSDDNDWKRCLICGIFWFDEGLCVNTGQLKILLGKSQSLINGALSKLHYETVAVSYLPNGELLCVMPFLIDFPTVARQWRMRKRIVSVSGNVSGNVSGSGSGSVNGRRNGRVKRSDFCEVMEKVENVSDETNEELKPCYFGCYCGCACKPDEISMIPCLSNFANGLIGDEEWLCNCGSSME
jgi:hypothetical protein